MFCLLTNTNLGAHFFNKINFRVTLLLKWCPIFDSLPLQQFSKVNNFLWACCFSDKNLFHFVPLAWKLDNPYYHTVGHQQLWGPFIYYVITFLEFLDPPPPLRQHVFSTKNKQKLALSDPPPPYKWLST